MDGREEDRLLRHRCPTCWRSQVGVELAQVVAVEQNPPAVGVVEPREQRRRWWTCPRPRARPARRSPRRATTGRPRAAPARPGGWGTRTPRPAARACPSTLGRAEPAARGNRRLPVEQLEDPLGGAARLHQVRPQIAQGPEREGHQQGVDEERGEPAHRQPARDDQPPAVPEHRRRRREGRERRRAHEGAGDDGPRPAPARTSGSPLCA